MLCRMSRSQNTPLRRFRLPRLAALALVIAAPVAWAAPESGSDGLNNWLVERGFSPVDPVAGAEAGSSPGGAPSRPTSRSEKHSTSELVLSAMNFLGVPYKHGGNDSSVGFDCSGFTRHIFENSLGLLLPRRVDEQAGANGLITVRRSELKPGDLVFFNTLKRTFSHVGIYIGEGKFIHAPRTGTEVRIESMSVSYWSRRFTGARRAQMLADARELRAAERAKAAAQAQAEARNPFSP
jgi:cell wall-associated NlpC family hydrolase